jgi:MFS family permease
MIPNLVPQEELGNALTLNTMLRQLATIVGPGIGGLVLGFFGVSVTYMLNTLSFMGIIGALLMMDPLPAIARRAQPGWELAVGGVRFLRSEPVVSSILGLDFLVNILGSMRALFPVFAAEILHVGPEGLGLLYSAPAAGAVFGALVMGAIGGRTWHPGWILVTCAAFGVCIIGFGLSGYFIVALVMLFGTGVADVTGEIMRSTLVQLRTPDDVRGRVTALTVVFTGGGPQLGQLQSGALASAVGPVEAAVAGGAGVLLSVALFCLNPHMRRLPRETHLTSSSVAQATRSTSA